ncbi:radical SAM protein [Prolixibacter sp. SD074]|jgi:wyosine [tRNA(Phe)-imidazoG37] synthetase (radical SAM superfamily)|uniref:radical SAM protein n=1 Tax=Prolixibacter sp. SD074 TaxID=2652391 RepID=UPI00126F3F0F|nr:radical SAM protein [Prolixibacter sp. SD074]GET30376.1 radical SAM protein [Prolixibacter sp. SD074]
MSTFLFDQTIFGPVKSRRLGVSLGINLLPNNTKVCSFDCIYCECGWTPHKREKKAELPSREIVARLLREKLEKMGNAGEAPDVLTFAGNGEPTLHPDFAEIIDDTIAIRDEYFPKARVAVLSNSTMLHRPNVVEALKKVDDNILKLDSAIPETIQLLDCPLGRFHLVEVIKNMKKFDGKLTIQTMFIRGEFSGHKIDNTTEEELSAWLKLLANIRPERVMIYTIARDTPSQNLTKVSAVDLDKIAARVHSELDIDVQVSG